MDSQLKVPLGQALNRFAKHKTQDGVQLLGKALPCSVVAVVSSGIVTVNFEVNAAPWQLPQITMPVLYSQYIRYPITVGDYGVAVPFDSMLGGLSGLGAGVPLLGVPPANLGALSFLWLGSTNWSPADDPQAVVVYAPNGSILRDTQKLSVMTVAPSQVTANTPNLAATGNAAIGTGTTGSTTSATGQTVTVMNGVITNIYSSLGGGGGPVNAEYFTQLTSQLNALTTQLEYFKNKPQAYSKAIISEVETQLLADLQAYVNTIFPNLQAQISAVQSQESLLLAFAALVTAPTNLATLLTWVTNFIAASIEPQYQAYLNCVVQLTALANAVAQLASAANSVATSLGGNVTIPTVSSSVGVGSAAGKATVTGVS